MILPDYSGSLDTSPSHKAFRFTASDKLRLIGILGLTFFLLSGAIPSNAADTPDNPFPPNSPEHAALSAASEFLTNDAFLLRQDYWQGKLGTETGKALQLQFFKGNRYRFFFAVSKKQLPDKALLHLHIYDKASKEVATVSSQGTSNVIDLTFIPKSTGLYLVLMSIEVPKNSSARTGISSVLFYGYE
ncbi:MAG: hypothetical protein GXP30_05365 [Verrucomicrobia bacterium]|nr:hypothetical protein [Verrucomicrobiota bacterium]